MSLVVIGLSHHSAPIEVLESLGQVPGLAADLADAVLSSATVSEAVVLATCNRLEIYAEAREFHPAVAAIATAFDAAAEAAPVTRHLYVRHEELAVAHLFSTAAGLDSMAVGEAQILGQIREALAAAQSSGRAGGGLNPLFQQALRVGKKAHSETDIDRHSVSLVEAGLDRAAALVGDLGRASVAVIGAGAMSGLAVASLTRAGARDLVVVNRTPERAQRLAESGGGRARDWSELADVVATSDLVITCTGAVGHVLTGDDLARAARTRDGRAQVVIDLALPRDIEPVAHWSRPLPQVEVLDLEHLGQLLSGRADSLEVARVQDLVTGEVAAYLTRRGEQRVAPTVSALRTRAADVVATELARLDHRVADMDEQTRAEVGRTVHRIVEKLLHTPTAKVKEFALDPDGPDYAAVLRELFDLDPKEIATVTTPPTRGGA